MDSGARVGQRVVEEFGRILRVAVLAALVDNIAQRATSVLYVPAAHDSTTWTLRPKRASSATV